MLVVSGDLIVDGHLMVDEECVVMCDGNLVVGDRVEVTYAPKDVMGISSAIIGTKDVLLGKGVRHMKFKPGHGNVEFPFKLMPCPFPLKIPYVKHGKIKWKDNPVAQAFLKLQQTIFKPIAKMIPGLSQFLTGTD